MVKVYYCDIADYKLNENIIENLVSVRKDYVNSITDVKRKTQSVAAWKLLEYAVMLNFPNQKFDYKSENGVFSAVNNPFYFSISHSNNFVAVAISNFSIGVDVEKCDSKILKLKSRLNCSDFGQTDIEKLTVSWTEKESLFKAKVGNNFFNKKLIDKNGNAYFLTVCTDEESADFIEIIGI